MESDDDDNKLVDDAVNELELHVTPRIEIPPEGLQEILMWHGGDPVIGPLARTALGFHQLWRRQLRLAYFMIAILMFRALLDLVFLLLR